MGSVQIAAVSVRDLQDCSQSLTGSGTGDNALHSNVEVAGSGARGSVSKKKIGAIRPRSYSHTERIFGMSSMIASSSRIWNGVLRFMSDSELVMQYRGFWEGEGGKGEKITLSSHV